MSEDVPAGRSWGLFLVGWVLLPTAVLVGLLLFLLRPRSDSGDVPAPVTAGPAENHLAQARTALAKQTDLATCRDVVQQLNAHLEAAGDHQPPALAADRDRLVKLLGLDAGGTAELASARFSPLDAHHLASCFLFRDAARSLELPPLTVDGKTVRQTALDRAAAGFAWAVRQVRLGGVGPREMEEPAPPAEVVRRGHGSALERAVVFLALLEQFGLDEDEARGLQGYLLFVPDDKGQRRLWACGVATGGEAGLALFDPRLGLPIPGPGGKGIATLAQARDDAAVLGQLKAGGLQYDVTPEQAKKAVVSAWCPLSAAAPRMRFLQDRLLRDLTWREHPLPAQVRVRLAEDPAALLDRARALAKGGPADAAELWPRGVGLLRQFFPPEDGGSDTGVRVPLRELRGFVAENDATTGVIPRQQLFRWQAVPWEEFPPYFRDSSVFRWDSPLGQAVRMTFAAAFLLPLTEPNTPRDQVLRGRFSRAVPTLVEEQEQAAQMRRRLQQAEDLRQGVDEWVRQAVSVYADMVRAKGTGEEGLAKMRVAELWRWKPGEPIEVLLNGAIAGPRGAAVMYQLALCRHEQAVRHQARADLGARQGAALPAEAEQARRAWADAEEYWREFLDANKGRPAMAAARRLRGEAQARLGQPAEAAATLRDVSAAQTDLEKLACLWLADQAAVGGK